MIKITLPDGHYYDEMLTAQGEQRPHYNASVAMVSQHRSILYPAEKSASGTAFSPYRHHL